MSYSRFKLAAAVLSIGLVAAACGSSRSSSPRPAGGGRTYTIGILTDATGLGASSNKTSVQGVQAGAVLAKRDGYTIKYVVADTGTSPATALTAAQKLVDQDHVLAVVAVSFLTFSAAPFLTSQGVPVLGPAEDGPEWLTAKNMFAVYGPTDTTIVTTNAGQYFKMEGATNIGTLGYSMLPSSAANAQGTGLSAQAAGLRAGYVNADFPLGSTNVEPVVLAMKAAGVNATYASVEPNTGFALITALRQSGDNVQVALLPTGYGGDLQQAGPNAQRVARDVTFISLFEPVEMHTPATMQFQSDLKSVGLTRDPTYAEYAGYASIAMLVQGLQGTRSNPSQPGLISALSHTTSFDAAGLLGSHPIDLSQRIGSQGPNNCGWFTKYTGSTFQLVPGADPLCGTVVPGVRVGPSS